VTSDIRSAPSAMLDSEITTAVDMVPFDHMTDWLGRQPGAGR
jgi:hypothetical protein